MIFFKTANVNIFLVIQTLIKNLSAACFASARCMRWGIGAAAIFSIQKTESKTVQIACVHIVGRTMAQFVKR